ncbi:MAG: hypothetical protein Q8883_02635 [Sweet potato little leaf phytoplasma]|nr:hypothetical protein [Sweet potato little leaf phytoplasma]
MVWLHGVPLSIISDKGTQFTSYYLKAFKNSLGTQVHLCTSFYLQKDGQAERTIQTLKDILRACVVDFKGTWDDHLPLIEFAYNNIYHSSIKMALFEALHGRGCRSPICWLELGEAMVVGPNLVFDALAKVKLISKNLRAAQSRQNLNPDVRRKDLEFKIGDFIYYYQI